MGSIDEELNALATPLGLRGASIEQLTGELFKANARGDQNRVQLIRQLLALQSDRNALEAEYAAQQEEIIEAQRKMADIQFLQQQMELLKVIKEAGRADLLEGLELGLDASLPDLLAAMTEAMETLIDQADDELQAASPSKVFKKRGEWIMEGLREGIKSVKISGAEIVAPIMPPASVADITNRNVTNTVYNFQRTLNFSGHYASQPAIRDRDDLAFVLAGMG